MIFVYLHIVDSVELCNTLLQSIKPEEGVGRHLKISFSFLQKKNIEHLLLSFHKKSRLIDIIAYSHSYNVCLEKNSEYVK